MLLTILELMAGDDGEAADDAEDNEQPQVNLNLEYQAKTLSAYQLKVFL